MHTLKKKKFLIHFFLQVTAMHTYSGAFPQPLASEGDIVSLTVLYGCTVTF